MVSRHKLKVSKKKQVLSLPSSIPNCISEDIELGWRKVKAASEYADLSEHTIRKLIKAGLKHSCLPSGTILIKLQDVDEYLEQFAITNKNSVDEIVQALLKDMDR